MCVRLIGVDSSYTIQIMRFLYQRHHSHTNLLETSYADIDKHIKRGDPSLSNPTYMIDQIGIITLTHTTRLTIVSHLQ